MSRRARILSLLTLVFGFWLFGVIAPYGLHVGEDGDLLYLVFATYKGQLQYVDFSTGYTPGYFYWHALLFYLFGVDALVMRVSVAVANSVSLYLLYRLAARLASPFVALLAPVAFLGSLLAFPPDFVTFNVPYPAWYNIVFWLGSLVAACAYVDRGRPRALFVAGLLAGASFSVKPNVGLFNLAALSFFLVWWNAPRVGDSRWIRALWWALGLGTLAGVVGIFWGRFPSREFGLFPLSLLVLAAGLLWNGRHKHGREGFVPGTVALLLGFALPTLPWLLYFLVRLGLKSFMSDVLLIGSSYELFFFIGHRTLGGLWDWGVAILALALALAPIAVRERWLPAWVLPLGLIVSGTAAVGYVAFVAPMPEGFYAAVATRVRDLAFFVLHAINWAGVAIVLRETRKNPAHRSRYLGSFVLVALSAPALTLGLYPRSDFMHLVISVPAALILGTALLDRIMRAWDSTLPNTLGWRVTTFAAVVGPPLLIAIILATPTLGLAARLSRYYLGGTDDSLMPLRAKRASLILEPSTNPRFSHLREAAEFIENSSTPDDTVLPFPNLHMLCFLAGRLNPAKQGYLHPGSPDHPHEAEMVRGLRQRPPKLVATLHDHELFVTTAPLYYFMLRDFVRSNYVFKGRFGTYDIFARQDVADSVASQGSSTVTETNWDDMLKTSDPNELWAAAEQVRRHRDPLGAAALARRALSHPPLALFMVRVAGEVADERAAIALAQLASDDYSSETGQAAASALFYVAGKSLIESYWFSNEEYRNRTESLRRELGQKPFMDWLRNRGEDGRLMYISAWAAGVTGNAEAVPYLLMMLGSSNLGMSTIAAHALTQLGVGPGTADGMVGLMRDDDMFLPVILIELYGSNPTAVREAMIRGLLEGTPKQKETVAYIASVIRDPELRAALEKVRDEDDGRPRDAAVYALESMDSAAMIATPRAGAENPRR